MIEGAAPSWAPVEACLVKHLFPHFLHYILLLLLSLSIHTHSLLSTHVCACMHMCIYIHATDPHFSQIPYICECARSRMYGTQSTLAIPHRQAQKERSVLLSRKQVTLLVVSVVPHSFLLCTFRRYVHHLKWWLCMWWSVSRTRKLCVMCLPENALHSGMSMVLLVVSLTLLSQHCASDTFSANTHIRHSCALIG